MSPSTTTGSNSVVSAGGARAGSDLHATCGPLAHAGKENSEGHRSKMTFHSNPVFADKIRTSGRSSGNNDSASGDGVGGAKRYHPQGTREPAASISVHTDVSAMRSSGGGTGNRSKSRTPRITTYSSNNNNKEGVNIGGGSSSELTKLRARNTKLVEALKMAHATAEESAASVKAESLFSETLRAEVHVKRQLLGATQSKLVEAQAQAATTQRTLGILLETRRLDNTAIASRSNAPRPPSPGEAGASTSGSALSADAAAFATAAVVTEPATVLATAGSAQGRLLASLAHALSPTAPRPYP
jgi:hypothetical protein